MWKDVWTSSSVSVEAVVVGGVRRRMLHGFILLSAAGLAGASAAGLRDAVARYDARDYGAAYTLFYGLAQDGEPEALYYLGLMHVMGQGVGRDPQAGVRWLEMSAERGFTDAASTLGNMYASGLGVPMDSAEAMKWLELAASLAEREGHEPDCD